MYVRNFIFIFLFFLAPTYTHPNIFSFHLIFRRSSCSYGVDFVGYIHSLLNCNWYVQLCLQDDVSALTTLKEEKGEESEVEASEEETLPSALLQEKNQEIDHLNNEIQRLEQELETTRDNKVKICTNRKLADSVVVPIVDDVVLNICLINCFDLSD